ncbi:hypothetical protein EF294_17875 [Gordonia oryzae]|uniref:Pyrrolo-quinoline quinone n=1 Tax=Gordonia oryzae TaxID=2487349 RepID=A0A3N4GAQ6_9ACTN|nr:PQQ-binding-like beta-propeller repeat protein [Gordonia oryzae]RPA57656.1 hypothetical protein EF294_17875 [Gordonia oryzae]
MGAVVMAVVAFVSRQPATLIGGDFGAVTSFLGTVVGVVVAQAVVVLAAVTGVMVRRVRRRVAFLVTPAISVLLATSVAVAAWAWRGSLSNNADDELLGFDVAPVIAIARWALTLMAASVAVLLVGAIRAGGPAATTGTRAVLVGALAGGLVVVCAAVGSIVVATPRPSVRSVAAVPIPSVPTSLGARIAYTVPALGPFSVTPAGPGFVVLGRDSVTAYHGETGQRRWVRSLADLPFGCRKVGIWAAGPAGHEVVLVTCSDGGYRHAVVGIDAVSGDRLWTNAEGWRVRVPGGTKGSIVGVMTYDRYDNPMTIGALDVRTGHTRWTAPHRECSDDSGVTTTSSALVAVSACGERPSLVTFDATSGVTRTIGLPSSPDSEASIIAVDGDRTAIVVERRVIHERKLAIVDVSQKGSVTTVPGTPGPSMLMRPVDQARYLQTDWNGVNGRPMSGMVDVRSASFSTIRGADLYPNGIPDDIPVGQRLAAVGDGVVSGVVATTEPNVVAVIAADGQATMRPAPCDKASGVLPVPGAILMTCLRHDRPNTVNDIVVLGIR